jgi:prepilin signal peptidase PulO-like enzyme (type II secretory pathway)
LGFLAGFILLVYFGLVAVIDIEHRLILHITSLIGAGIGLGIGIWLHGLARTLAGGLAGFISMFLLYQLGFFFLRVLKRGAGAGEALGFGDVILGGVLGLILGWPAIFASLLLTILLSGAASLIYLLVMILAKKYSPSLSIPYGPYMVLGATLLLYFPALLASWVR